MSANADYTQAYSPCFPEEQGEWVWVPKNTMPGFPAPTHQSPMYRSPSGSSHTSGPFIPYTPSVSPTYSPVGSDFPSVSDGSPVEPLLEGFDFDMSLYLDNTYLGDVNPSDPWAFPVPDNAASMDLFPTGLDAGFSGLDFGLGFEGANSFAPVTPLTASPASSLSYSNIAAVPLAPLLPSTPTSTTTSPYSATSPATAAPKPGHHLPCPEPTCPKTFPTKSDLRYAPHPPSPNPISPQQAQQQQLTRPAHSRHERKHRAPVCCPLPACGKGHLDNRALARHLWAKHPEYAAQTGARSERVRCTFCDYEGRQDNVVRHMKRHAK
jgi:hypothetical protein